MSPLFCHLSHSMTVILSSWLYNRGFQIEELDFHQKRYSWIIYRKLNFLHNDPNSWVSDIPKLVIFICISEQGPYCPPWLTHFLPIHFVCEYLLLSFPCASAPTLWPSFPYWGKSWPVQGSPHPYLEETTTRLTSLIIIIMSSRSISGHSHCCNCRFDHSLHFVSPHLIQAPLIGNSGPPKARQHGDQGQLPHCLVFKLVPSWFSDHHQEAGDSET